MTPNLPSLVNEGYIPVVFGAGCPGHVRVVFTILIAPLGTLPEILEKSLETYAIITYMGPTYLWFQMAELVRIR